ncbi:MAG: DNA translocase FtsK 4TM domain-containing protein, partial [Eubacteriales bacterium]
MATKKKRRYKNKNKTNEIIGVLLIALGALSVIAVYLQLNSVFGDSIKQTIFGLFGTAGYAIPALLIAMGVLVIAARHTNANPGKLLLILLVFLFVISILHVGVAQTIGVENGFSNYTGQSYNTGAAYEAGGGLIGSLLVFPCMVYLGYAGSYIVLIAAMVLCIIALTNLSIKRMSEGIGSAVKNQYDTYRTRAEENRRNRKDELYVEDLREPHEAGQAENPYDFKVEAAESQVTLKRFPKSREKQSRADTKV